MGSHPIDEVIQIAVAAGISADLFHGWDGTELALYQDVIGTSAEPEIARRMAEEKSARGDWTLDLGIRAVAVPRAQGEILTARLDAAGIRYEKRSVGDEYMRRVHGVADTHVDVLRELA